MSCAWRKFIVGACAICAEELQGFEEFAELVTVGCDEEVLPVLAELPVLEPPGALDPPDEFGLGPGVPPLPPLELEEDDEFPPGGVET